jgi:hypothetical protein
MPKLWEVKGSDRLSDTGDSLEAQGLPYRSGRSPDWLKMKNPAHPAVKREEEEDWSR